MDLALEVLLPPFVACLVLTGIHTYLGLHVVSRGVIFVDLALAQIAALGATFAFLLGYDPNGTGGYLYSLGFAVVGAAIFAISRFRDQKIPQEAIIGITYAVASALAILIADRAPQGSEFVEAMLTGALLWVPWDTIVKVAIIYGIVGLFHWTFRRPFLSASLHHGDPPEGFNVRLWDFLFYTSFGFVITSSVAMAGILLVFSFLVIPTVIALMFASRIGSRLLIGWCVGTVVSTVGLGLSYVYDFPSGPAVVATFGGTLILASLLRYLLSAPSKMLAAAKVAAVAAFIAFSGWLAVSHSPRMQEARVEAVVATADDPAQTIAEALEALESSPDAPPPGAVRRLVAAQADFHRLMATGRIVVREDAVRGLANASGDGGVGELLEEIAYHADDPYARLRAAEGLVERGNGLGVPALIELLRMDTPVFLKTEAVETLRRATGESFGYDPEGDPDAQSRALAQWEAWWEAHKSEPLVGAIGQGKP